MKCKIQAPKLLNQQNKGKQIRRGQSQIIKPSNTKFKTPRKKNLNLKTESSLPKKTEEIVTTQPLITFDKEFQVLKRSLEKGEHLDDVCPICNEKIGRSKIAITSCLHIFHLNCLYSFRALSIPSKQKCPKCKSLYFFDTMDTEQIYLNKCATKIQKVIRGFLLRNKLESILPQNCSLFNKILSKKAKENNEKLIDVVESQSDVVDAILTSINQELEWSRSLMKAIEIQERAVDWDEIRKEIKQKGFGPCPICLREIKEQDCTITSCKHCFHTKCINDWGSYCSSHDKMQKTCPVCRSFFQSTRYKDCFKKFELPKLVEDSYTFNMI